MYKQSYYVVSTPISKDDPASKKIVFSTRTSEAVVMTDDVYDKLQTGRFEELPNDYLNVLLEKKFVVPQSENELLNILNENKEVINNETMLYEVIQPSAMCQLGCDYCGQVHEKKNTSDKIAEHIFQRIEKKLRSNPKLKALKIGWFGGEPLMALGEIRKLTAKFKALAADLEIPYSSKVVTNGLSLKSNIFVELAKELNVTSLEITLDGTANFHDARRHTKEGGGTFQYIFKNLLDIVNRDDFHQLGCSISIRCNVDKRNYHGVTPLIKLLAENKLQDKISHFYVASVYSWGNDAHLKSFSKEEFAELEIEWIIEQYRHGFQPYLYPGRVRSLCIAVSPNSEMYDAYGNIFNCTEVSYVPVYEGTDYIHGNVVDDGSYTQKRIHGNWNDRIGANDFQCHSCRMLPVCGGGCPKQWTENRVACPPPKFNIKERLILSYLHAKKGLKEVAELANLESTV